jgi:hypothetical protein
MALQNWKTSATFSIVAVTFLEFADTILNFNDTFWEFGVTRLSFFSAFIDLPGPRDNPDRNSSLHGSERPGGSRGPGKNARSGRFKT